MKEGWDRKSLGEVCEIVNGSTPLRTNKEFWENGNYPWFTIDDIREQGRIITETKQKVTATALSKLRVLPVDSVLLCCTASVGEYAITKIELTTNQQFNGLIVTDRKKLDPEFLLHYCSTLKDKLLGLSGKTTIDFIAISKLKLLEIPLPSLPEQQRIVSIIDKAFEAIDKAIENTQKNLQNAKELFESYLNSVFENEGHGWEEKKWCDVLKIISGRNQSDVEDQNGRYPILGSAGKVMGYATQYLCEANTTIIGRKGTINSPMFIEEPFWNVDTAFGLHSGPSLNSRFLYYFCCSYDFTKEDKGSGRPSLVKSDLLKLTIPLPSLTIQIEIVEKIDTLKIEIQQLQSKYQQKLRDLEELKRSILNKAFEGEL